MSSFSTMIRSDSSSIGNDSSGEALFNNLTSSHAVKVLKMLDIEVLYRLGRSAGGFIRVVRFERQITARSGNLAEHIERFASGGCYSSFELSDFDQIDIKYIALADDVTVEYIEANIQCTA